MSKKRKTQTGYAEFSMSDLADAMYGERADDMMRRLAKKDIEYRDKPDLTRASSES